MLKRYATGLLAVSAAVAFALAGCSGGPQAEAPSNGQQAQGTSSSASDLADLTARGYDVDYDRLASPAAAVAASKLIVAGKLVDITEGMTFGDKGDHAGRGQQYATFVIQADKALKGYVAAGTKVHVQVNKSVLSTPAEMASVGKGLSVVAVLDDISSWTPAPGVAVIRPAGAPATGPLYLAFPDGLWLQGATDKGMVGVHAHTAELGAAWGAPATLDQYWATLEKAAG